MREIKFRGYKDRSEPFVYGSLSIKSMRWGSKYEIITLSDDEEEGDIITHIHPESIGQYTGLKDKNGKEIYEGDIVKTDFKQDGSHESIQVIEFYEGAFGSRNKDDHFRIPALFSGRATEGMNTNYYEVIGNIHQSPELLKGGSNA